MRGEEELSQARLESSDIENKIPFYLARKTFLNI